MKIIFLLFLFSIVNSAHLPPFTKACSKSDPNFEKCSADACVVTIKNFAAGYKPLNVPTLEPFIVESQHIPGNGGSINLIQNYTDMHVYGITNLKVDNFKTDFDNGVINVNARHPHIEILAKYHFQGSILILPVNGHGNCNITLVNVKIKSTMFFERFVKKTKTHIRLTELKIVVDAERVFLDFENLIDGNEQLSNQVSKALQENSMFLFKDIKPTYEEAFGLVFKSAGNQVFTKVPENEIFLD